jgi:hypothetical protein
LFASSELVYPAPDVSRVIVGLARRSDLPASYTNAPSLNVLRGAGWLPEEAWTQGSITGARLLLVASWLLTFSSFVTLLAAFAQAQRRRPHRT